MIISIDIGTSYSSLCYLNKEEKAQPIEIATGMSIYGSKYSLPSAIFVEDSGNVLIGQAAMNMRKLKPQNFRAEFKRDLGQNVPIILGQKSFLPEDIYTEMFRHMKACAEKYGKIEKAIITYPASYRQKKCEKIQKAAKNAGLFNVELIDEPTAAALNYRNDGLLNDGDKFLVYDFGGGTFDVSLMQYQNGECEPLTLPMGAEHCGGIDVDRIIFSDILSKIDKTLLEQLSGNQIYKMRFESEIAEQSVKIKHHLSQYDDISVQIPIGFDMVEYHLTREQLNEKIVGLVSQTIDCCQAILNDAAIEAKELNGIVLVGGTSRIPLVRTMLENFARGVKLYANVDPELAIAQGAVCRVQKSSQVNALNPISNPTHNPKTETNNSTVLVPNQDSNQGCPENATAEVQQYYVYAMKGDMQAQYLLGVAFLEGEKCTEDEGKAIIWLELSAKQGYAEAQYLLSACYENEIGVQKSEKKSFEWLTKAAENGLAEAQFGMAVVYENGEGVPKDLHKAFDWYQKAAEQGYDQAQNQVGLYYYNGHAIRKNYSQAFSWFMKAAEQDLAVAQNNVAYCYQEGQGVTKDISQALIWYKKALDNGYEDAAKEIERLNKPQISLDELKKYTQSIAGKYNMGNHIFIVGNLNADKLNNAKEKYASNMKIKDVLIQYDDTMWGGARDGFIMTGDTFYWHNLGSDDCGEIPLSEIVAFGEGSDGKYISIDLKDGQKVSSAWVSYGDIPKMVNCLNNFLNYINTHCLWT